MSPALRLLTHVSCLPSPVFCLISPAESAADLIDNNLADLAILRIELAANLAVLMLLVDMRFSGLRLWHFSI